MHILELAVYFGGSQTLVSGALSAAWGNRMLPSQGFQALSAVRYFHSYPHTILPDAILLPLSQEHCITVNIRELQIICLDMGGDLSLVRCDPITVCPFLLRGMALIKKCKSGEHVMGIPDRALSCDLVLWAEHKVLKHLI